MSVTPTVLAPAIEGFGLSAGLIIAIGAQNAFVLRQGLMRAHVGAVATICAVSDAILIAIGVAGAGSLVADNPGLVGMVTLAGAAFLLVYGGLALRRALWPSDRHLKGRGEGAGLRIAIVTCLSLTFLNPHVYLDTVVLIGAVSARHAGAHAVAFAAGAMLASLVWFFGIGYGARLAAPFFARPGAWRLVDAAVALTMLVIAGRLLGDVLLT